MWTSTTAAAVFENGVLDEFGYPPVTHDDVYAEVLEQAENFKKYNDMEDF